MGTNFYRIPTEAEILARKQKLIDNINNLDLSASSVEDGFRVEVEDSWERSSCWDDFIEGTSIHLGKRSSGWKFCWNFQIRLPNVGINAPCQYFIYTLRI